MKEQSLKKWISLDVEFPVWNQFFTVAPFVVIGTKEGEDYDLAPKHMVTPLGHDNTLVLFVHQTMQLITMLERKRLFTVSFPRPNRLCWPVWQLYPGVRMMKRASPWY